MHRDLAICRSKTAIRAAVARWRTGGDRIALVPTMGALHDGHAALVAAARASCDRVVVSIFVNPTQFGPGEDFEAYPRDEPADLARLRVEGVDAVFLPTVSEMYHPDAQTIVEATTLSGILIGALRPGHFRGVATVVAKLLNIVAPDEAVFGAKDFQQLAVIRTMVRDLDMPVRITGVPTLRAPDGLALSSRNARLTPAQRAAAPALNAALDAAEALAAAGPVTAEALEDVLRAGIAEAPGAVLDSVDIRDAMTLAEVQGPLAAPVVLLLAVHFGDVLLIDQREVSSEAST